MSRNGDWPVRADQLPTLLAPFGLAETVDACFIHSQLPPDAPAAQRNTASAAILNRRHRQGVAPSLRLTSGDVARVQERAAMRCPGLRSATFFHSQQRKIRQELATEQLGAAAAPPISTCLDCGSQLPPAETENDKAFFYCTAAPPQEGLLCKKQCSCGCTYFLDGRENGAAQKPPGAKRPQKQLYLEPEQEHPQWVRVTGETVVGVDLLERYSLELHHMVGSFEAATHIHNCLHGRGTGSTPPECVFVCARVRACACVRACVFTCGPVLTHA